PATALAAIDAYCQVPITWDSWSADGRNCWQRAIQLCLKLRDGVGERLANNRTALLGALLACSVDDSTLPLLIASLLYQHGLANDEDGTIASHLEHLAEKHEASGNYLPAQELYEAAHEWYVRQECEGKAWAMTIRSAETFVQRAHESQSQSPTTDHLAVASFY